MTTGKGRGERQAQPRRRSKGLETAIRVAQERHIRLENERIERLEAELVAAYISEIEAFLSSEA